MSQNLSREGEKNKCEVDTDKGEENDDEDAGHGLADRGAARETGAAASGCGGVGDAGGVGAGEACGVVHGFAAGRVDLGVLGGGAKGEEPGACEDCGVCSVQDRVDEVEVGEGETLEGRRFADMWHECDEYDERDERVQVHRELEEGESVAGDEGEDSVEAGELIEEEGERDHFCAEAEGGYEEEGLCAVRLEVTDMVEPGERAYSRAR